MVIAQALFPFSLLPSETPGSLIQPLYSPLNKLRVRAMGAAINTQVLGVGQINHKYNR